jgi:hypothetical protein
LRKAIALAGPANDNHRRADRLGAVCGSLGGMVQGQQFTSPWWRVNLR